MANRLIKVGNSFNTPQKQYIADSLDDLIASGLGNFGDIAICGDKRDKTAITYMKDSNGEWKEVSLGSSGGGGAIKQLPDPTAEDEGKIAKVIDGQWNIGEDSGEKQLPDVTAADNGKIAKVVNGHWDLGTESGGGGTVEALSNEEMMELFADTGINETAGLKYNEYTEDAAGIYIYDEDLSDYRLLDQSDPDDYYVENEEGDYVYDESLQEYRPYVEGDTGTRYSLRQRYNYVDSGFAGYVEYVEDKNGDYVWDEELQAYRLYEQGDMGTRYSIGETYILIY